MRPRRLFTSGMQLLTTPQTLLTFLIGGIALGVLGNAAYQVLTNYFGTNNLAMLGIIIVALLVLAGVVAMLGHLAQRWRPAPPLPDKQTPHKRRGLIILISNAQTARRALAWHQETLEWCWLVCSEQSMPLATQLKTELQAEGKKADLVLINDVYDPLECRNKVDAIYTQLPAGLNATDVILDFTGMTSMASVGSVLACLDEQRSLQYTPGVFDAQLQAIQPRDPVEVVLTWGMVYDQKATTGAARV